MRKKRAETAIRKIERIVKEYNLYYEITEDVDEISYTSWNDPWITKTVRGKRHVRIVIEY